MAFTFPNKKIVKGVYTVYFNLEERKTIECGALGEINFEPGTYVYVGSAMNSLESRIHRHYHNQGNKHWHIDYFSEEAEPESTFFVFTEDSSLECFLADFFAEEAEIVESFGASDCGCSSHLFRLL
ncbi:MAG: Uri superfamily endonuclease [Candidatus Nanohaloarchaea archaeon]|jgi:Uri superfamily endonuclease